MNQLVETGAAVRSLRQVCSGLVAILTCCLFLLVPVSSHAQVSNGALSGTVTDSTGAVVPNAKIVMKNQDSGTTRESVSNEAGFFNIVAVPPATYKITVSAQGFNSWEVKNLVFNQGEERNIPKIVLKLGAASETVEVSADLMAVPVDTSESRETLDANMITQLNIQGRNAAELIKIMPGMAIAGGLSNSAYSSMNTQTNVGPIGNFSAAGGQPNGGIGMSIDGASILDVGNAGTQTANINQDTTAELTIIDGAFGAEYAKGPVNIQGITKSGGSTFHGTAYLYGRNGSLNANDGQNTQYHVAKTIDHYWYPGFTLSGPVVIPHTGFNKNRDKLFFFGSYEYMMQHPAGSFHQTDVPTDAMLNGDFSGVTALAGQSAQIPCAVSNKGTNANFGAGSFCDRMWNAGNNGNGIFNTNLFDPIGLKYIGMMRAMGIKPNQDPAAHSGYNYGWTDTTPSNRWEGRLKMDYNINSKMKLSGTFSHQSENDSYPYGNLYWEPSGSVHYPGGGAATVLSDTYNAQLTNTITPTLTSDFTFAYAYFTVPAKPSNASAMSPTTTGIDVTLPYSYSAVGILPQIPNIYSWACNGSNNQGCFPSLYAYSYNTDFNGAVGNKKQVPSISENIAKVWRTHTIKGGFYWEKAMQLQSTLNVDGQGGYEFDQWSKATSNNPLADLLFGNVDSFSQSAALPLTNIQKYNYSFYLTDAWKIKNITLNYGARLEHNGQWLANDGAGLAVWNPATYVNDPSTASGTSGLVWHKTDSSIPLSGWTSRAFTVAPRVGIAYDVFGNGNTVVRGGFGLYRWQVSIGDATGSYSTALGIGNASKSGFTGMNTLSAASFNPNSLIGSKVAALKQGDSATPYTENWNLIISQRLPGKSTLELQYQGNRTENSIISNNNNSDQSVANINKIPVGTLLSSQQCISNPDYCGSKVGNATAFVKGTDYNPSNAQFYRPYADYLYLSVASHGSYSNYHAFVAQWAKQSGPVTYQFNYTFSKVLGTRDGNTGNGQGNGAIADPFNLKNNYGVLAYDRTQIFNAAYIIHLPEMKQGNALAKRALNGWQLSGITQLQSGAPLQANTNNLNITAPVNIMDVLGTPSANLLPVLTCDPRKGRWHGQYFNPNCFSMPTVGQPATATSAAVLGVNGQAQWPYLRTPAYVNSDLALFKNVQVSERQKIQFRVSAFNFLNMKLKQFGTGNDVKAQWTVDPKTGANVLPSDFTGYPGGIVGHRVMEFALKYEF